MDRGVHLAALAAWQAWNSARTGSGWEWTPERVGVVAGTSRGPVEIWSDLVDSARQHRKAPSLAPASAIAGLSGALSILLNARGPCFTVSAACASSASAIILGAQQLLLGEADVVVVGGAEAPLYEPLLCQLDAAGLLGTAATPEKACRPFDVTRNGTVLGEGAAFLILETEAGARQRGANILAHLSGWAMSSEAHDRVGLDATGESLARIMTQAIHRSSLVPGEIGYINLHGTGTRLNDLAEAHAVQRVFGAEVLCSSTKPVTGHCMGASAALEAVIAIESLRRQVVPPSANCQQQDAACAIHLVREKASAFRARAVMSTSLGLWGHQAALVFSR